MMWDLGRLGLVVSLARMELRNTRGIDTLEKGVEQMVGHWLAEGMPDDGSYRQDETRVAG